MSHLAGLKAKLMKLSKNSLIRKLLRIEHDLCPDCKVTFRTQMGGGSGHKVPKKRKGRKMSHAEKVKFLARLNKGRRKKGLKPIHVKR